jgi:microcystin-dependent protein
MKKIFYPFIFLLTSQLFAQVGIGTNTPDNSAMLEVQSNNRGILFPRLTSAQRSSIASPAAGLYVFDTNTNSLWYYNGAIWINTVSESTYGDMKSGFQAADHSGWIKLDGRAISTLSSNQQAVAISLGFTTNLPNATSAYPVQNTGTLGSVVGANTTTLTQANLPVATFAGTAATSGSHSHTTDPASVNTTTNGNHNHSGTTDWQGNHSHGSNAGGGQGGLGLVLSNGYSTVINTDFSYGELNVWTNPYALSIYDSGNHYHNLSVNYAGDHIHSVDIPSTTSSTDAGHTHTVSVSSGGSATPINIAPKSLIVNMFVYLGQ